MNTISAYSASAEYRPEVPPAVLEPPLANTYSLRTRHALLQVVLQVTDAVEPSMINAGSLKKWGVDLQPQRALAILVYYYLIGVYSSQTIATEVSKDILLRCLIANESLDWMLVHRFRHDNQSVLQECMEKVCWIMNRENPEGIEPGLVFSSTIHRREISNFLLLSRIVLEVEKRLALAAQMDSMEMDD
ncbi:MAG TPA: hypothetical protein P5186_26435 [Candidatus Paceibacterota bacterium]|nr:hypothetical protein [Verrucomicrobiota bacterium]HRY51592.1 hypothetical protein [Candidatus Paceibacterota bacterium]